MAVYTPTYRRPFLLELCKTSVENQSVPVYHMIVDDEIGLGIGGMYADIRNHAEFVEGEYVMVLSDDNILVDAHFAAELETLVWGLDEKPDVVVFKGQTGPTLQPASWGGEPVLTKIDLSCFAVRRDLWVEYSDRWGEHYAGDFDFIHALYEDGHLFAWWDRFVFQAIKISKGAAE